MRESKQDLKPSPCELKRLPGLVVVFFPEAKKALFFPFLFQPQCPAQLGARGRLPADLPQGGSAPWHQLAHPRGTRESLLQSVSPKSQGPKIQSQARFHAWKRCRDRREQEGWLAKVSCPPSPQPVTLKHRVQSGKSLRCTCRFHTEQFHQSQSRLRAEGASQWSPRWFI